MAGDAWASDAPVSLPAPLDHDGLVPMGGFVFTERGLFHDITATTVEQLTPTFGPVFDARLPVTEADGG